MSAGDWKDLYGAAENGDLQRVKYHIKAGVDPNYQHPEIMCTPLVASVIAGHIDIVEYLLAHDTDPNLRSELDNLTPIEAAEKYGRTCTFDMLIAAGARKKPSPLWLRFWKSIFK